MRWKEIINTDGDESDQILNIRKSKLVSVLQKLLERVEVDEEFYLGKYQDVAEAVFLGNLPSAKYHFVHFGYYESKLPRAIKVDESFYLSDNSDVFLEINNGNILDAQTHFENDGYKEGRIPYEGFSLFD